MRAAVIDQTGTVVNVALIGDDYDPGDGLTLVELDDDSPVGIAWTWDGAAWTEGTPPQPEPAPPTIEQMVADLQQQLTSALSELSDARAVQDDLLLAFLMNPPSGG